MFFRRVTTTILIFEVSNVMFPSYETARSFVSNLIIIILSIFKRSEGNTCPHPDSLLTIYKTYLIEESTLITRVQGGFSIIEHYLNEAGAGIFSHIFITFFYPNSTTLKMHCGHEKALSNFRLYHVFFPLSVQF